MKSFPNWHSGTNEQVMPLLLAAKENCADKKDHYVYMSKVNREVL